MRGDLRTEGGFIGASEIESRWCRVFLATGDAVLLYLRRQDVGERLE
jgi:hypothetical protein